MANPPFIPQGRQGYLKINGVYLPAFNVQILSPRNLMIPPIIGRGYQWLYAEGVQTSAISCPILLRDVSGEALSTSFLNLFFARTADDTSSFTIEAYDGAQKITSSSAKAESLSLSVGKGSLLAFNCTFLAPGLPVMAAPPSAAAVDASAPLTFSAISMTGFSTEVYGFEWSYSNGHLLNAPLVNDAGANPGVVASRWDAGMMSAGATFTFRQQHDATDNFTIIPANGATVTMTITGTGKTRTFTLKNCVPENPRDKAFATGQVFRTTRCAVLGDATSVTTVPPISFDTATTTFGA